MTSYCANCASFSVGECHRNAPMAAHGDQNNWPRVGATDWCTEWTTGAGYAGTSTLTWGHTAPSGGNNGDFYILIQDPADAAYQNINGTWTQIGTLT